MPRLEDVLSELAAVPGARAAALGGFDGLLVDQALPAGASPLALEGAVVELTHAWNAVRRAAHAHLEAGTARELIVVADGGVALARLVGDRWFAWLWARPDVAIDEARAALRVAAERLAEVVA